MNLNKSLLSQLSSKSWDAAAPDVGGCVSAHMPVCHKGVKKNRQTPGAAVVPSTQHTHRLMSVCLSLKHTDMFPNTLPTFPLFLCVFQLHALQALVHTCKSRPDAHAHTDCCWAHATSPKDRIKGCFYQQTIKCQTSKAATSWYWCSQEHVSLCVGGLGHRLVLKLGV